MLSSACYLCLFLLLASSSPLWLNRLAQTEPNWTRANGPSFALLFFVAWLPFLNGLFDCISVGLTQIFLRRMKVGRWTPVWWFLDGLTAVVLVIGLYLAVFGLLHVLKAMGWGVDPKAIFLQFRKDPASSSWLILLAITNLVPTLLHWALGLTAIVQSRGTPRSADLQRWARQLLANEPLGEGNAETFAFYLMGGNKVASLALALGLICLFVQVFQWAIPAGFKWLLA